MRLPALSALTLHITLVNNADLTGQCSNQFQQFLGLSVHHYSPKAHITTDPYFLKRYLLRKNSGKSEDIEARTEVSTKKLRLRARSVRQ